MPVDIVSVGRLFGPWHPTAKLARQVGAKYNFTGKPCKAGHTELRSATGGKCVECNRIRSRHLWQTDPNIRAKDRERCLRRLDDPEFRAAGLKRWHAVKIRKRKEQEGFRECERQYAAERWLRIKDDEEFRRANADRARRWFSENRDYAKQANRERYRRDPMPAFLASRLRRARIRGAVGAFSGEDIKKILTAQGGKCVYCGVSVLEDRHIDHIIPLSRGGSNWPTNLQVLCPHCNLSKNAKTHEEFMAYRRIMAA